MDVTLKRAADLSRAALDAANSITIDPQVSISIHAADPATVAEEARRRFDERLGQFEALLAAHYSIRALIGAANARAGLDDLLTRRAMLDAVDKRLAAVTEKACRGAVADLAIVEAQITSIKQRLVAGHEFYGGDDVPLAIVDVARAEQIASRRAAIRRERSNVTDAVAGLNLNSRITLDAGTVATLKEARIIG